jgi:uncharacterized protein (TIGR03546 family)
VNVKFLVKTLKSLFGNTNPMELSLAIAFGVLLGLVPGQNLTWIVIFFLTVFLKTNLGAQMLFALLVGLLSPMADPLLNGLGQWVLVDLGFSDFLVSWHRLPILPWLKLNNTLVMGGLLGGLILFVPVTLLAAFLIGALREKIVPAIANSAFVKGIYKIPLVQTIAKLWSAAGEVGE